MRVLISGGGVAGLTLAYWLHRYHIQPVVIERASHLRREGHGIGLFGTGYDVAERMGIMHRLQAQHIPIDSIASVKRSGKPITTLNQSLLQKVMRGRYLGLMHATLEEALYEAVAGDVEVRFGRSLLAVEHHRGAVVATLNDGTTESFAILIGADGVHSCTRELVFGPEEQFGRYLGYVVACYCLPDRYGIGRTCKMYTRPRRLVGAMCSDRDAEIMTFFIYPSAHERRIPREQRLSRLRQEFAGMGWITQQLLDDVGDPNAIFMDTLLQIQMPSWHRGRVVLVGDACGCPTLISVQGASLAMGGAYVLAEALGTAGNYEEAFCVYEQKMQPYVQTQQKNARRTAKSFLLGSIGGMWVQQWMLKVLLREAWIDLLRRQLSAESILQTQG